MIELNQAERKVRDVLVAVASRRPGFKRNGLISYKELWGHISDEPWGQNRTQMVVELISRVSGFELERGRPPLNELVVPVGKRVPRQKWDEIKWFHGEHLGTPIPYSSHEEAQEACWQYWENGGLKAALSEIQVEEGYQQDRASSFRTRNRGIVEDRKRHDGYTCQACDFQLKVGNTYVIDCHHRYPFAGSEVPRITNLEQLVCLCPTCHRIAHTSNPPLDPDEIRALLHTSRGV